MKKTLFNFDWLYVLVFFYFGFTVYRKKYYTVNGKPYEMDGITCCLYVWQASDFDTKIRFFIA